MSDKLQSVAGFHMAPQGRIDKLKFVAHLIFLFDKEFLWPLARAIGQ